MAHNCFLKKIKTFFLLVSSFLTVKFTASRNCFTTSTLLDYYYFTGVFKGMSEKERQMGRIFRVELSVHPLCETLVHTGTMQKSIIHLGSR